MLKPIIVFIIGFFTGLNEISNDNNFAISVPPREQPLTFVDIPYPDGEIVSNHATSDNKFIIFIPNKYFSSAEEPRIIIDEYVNDKGFKVTKEQVGGDLYGYSWRYTYQSTSAY